MGNMIGTPSQTSICLQIFSLVVCDGPPGTTRGGRYGFLPVMLPYLSSKCTILLDDVEREGEQKTLLLWKEENRFSYKTFGGDRKFSEISLAR